MHRRDIEQNTKAKYTQKIYCITYTNIIIQTLL